MPFIDGILIGAGLVVGLFAGLMIVAFIVDVLSNT